MGIRNIWPSYWRATSGCELRRPNCRLSATWFHWQRRATPNMLLIEVAASHIRNLGTGHRIRSVRSPWCILISDVTFFLVGSKGSCYTNRSVLVPLHLSLFIFKKYIYFYSNTFLMSWSVLPASCCHIQRPSFSLKQWNQANQAIMFYTNKFSFSFQVCTFSNYHQHCNRNLNLSVSWKRKIKRENSNGNSGFYYSKSKYGTAVGNLALCIWKWK